MPEIKWAPSDEPVTSGEMLAWVRGMVRSARYLEFKARQEKAKVNNLAVPVEVRDESKILARAFEDSASEIWEMVKADLGGIDA